MIAEDVVAAGMEAVQRVLAALDSGGVNYADVERTIRGEVRVRVDGVRTREGSLMLTLRFLPGVDPSEGAA